MIPSWLNRLRSSFAMLAVLTVLSACSGSDAQDDVFDGAMVLAFSWQTAFCETRPRLRECRSQKAGRYDVDHFSLHGLWPQPGSNVYCGVANTEVEKDKKRRWKKLQGLGLSDSIKQSLWKIMPGAQSFLHRHEWIKHGTCYSNSPEIYYADSLALMALINQSAVRDMFAGAIGKTLQNRDVRRAFDKAFGEGVGDRVRVACKRDGQRMLITEITLGLRGQVTGTPDIKDLALASVKTKPGCPSGIVDRVGLQ